MNRLLLEWALMRTRLILLIPFVLGLLIRLHYFSYTDAYTRQHDVHGHIDHINYIQLHGSIPTNKQCWECFQPPLYYIAASSVAKISDHLGIENRLPLLQSLSLFLFMTFLLFAAAFFALLFSNPTQLAIAFSLLVFWPSGIMSSVRIGNDVLFYAIYAIPFYFLSRWLVERRFGYLIACAMLAAFAPLVKSTGFLLWALLGCVVVFDTFKQRRFERRYFVTIGAFALGAAAWIFNFTLKSAGQVGQKNLIGIEAFPENQRVGIGFRKFSEIRLRQISKLCRRGPMD